MLSPQWEKAMPLRSLINQSMLSSEDADLLESLFNQFSSPNDDDEHRLARAAGLVKLFVDGQRDSEKLIGFLISTAPDCHSMSGRGESERAH